MKKLNLNNLNLEVDEILNREVLNSIYGGGYGYGAASCTADCLDSEGHEYQITCEGSNCVASDFVGCKSDVEQKSCP